MNMKPQARVCHCCNIVKCFTILGNDNEDLETKQTYVHQYESMQISTGLYPSDSFNAENAEVTNSGKCKTKFLETGFFFAYVTVLFKYFFGCPSTQFEEVLWKSSYGWLMSWLVGLCLTVRRVNDFLSFLGTEMKLGTCDQHKV